MLPIAMAGAMTETKPRSGASSGHSAPITPTGSFMASAMPLSGTPFAAPSCLSAQAAQVKSRRTAASTSASPRFPVMSRSRAANSAARAERFSAM